MTTVLVVDDSAVDRRLAGGLLEHQAGWSVLYASDGQDALVQMELHLPDLVLTDLQMPGLNGLELVAALREDYPLVPVVIMTAQGSEEIAVAALKRGAAGYVPKRRLAVELHEIVQQTLDAAGRTRSHARLFHRMVRDECSFLLENDLTLIPPAINYLQGVLAQMRRGDATDRLRIGVALEEALSNAYYHGNLEVSSSLREEDYSTYYDLARRRAAQSPYRDRRISLKAVTTPHEARYVVEDEGPGFDPASLPDPSDPANLERPSGRGLVLMQAFMDEVSFNAKGNQVTLVKRFASHSAPS